MNYVEGTLYGAERALNVVIEYLRANLPDAVQAVNDAYQDDGLGLTITAPEEGSIGNAEWRLAYLPPTPALAVLLEADRLMEVQEGYMMTRHPITLVVAESDADAGILRRKMMRHVAALRLCLDRAMAAADLVFFWPDTGVIASYSSIAIVDETFFADAQLYIEVQLEELYG